MTTLTIHDLRKTDAMDREEDLRTAIAAKDAEIAALREALRRSETKAWEIAGLDGSEMDVAYNQGWRDGAERVAHAIAAFARAALEMSGGVK